MTLIGRLQGGGRQVLSVGGAVGSGWQEPRDVSRRRSRRRRRRSSSGGAAAARLSTPTLLLSTSSSLGPAQKFPLPLSA